MFYTKFGSNEATEYAITSSKVYQNYTLYPSLYAPLQVPLVPDQLDTKLSLIGLCQGKKKFVFHNNQIMLQSNYADTRLHHRLSIMVVQGLTS